MGHAEVLRGRMRQAGTSSLGRARGGAGEEGGVSEGYAWRLLCCWLVIFGLTCWGLSAIGLDGVFAVCVGLGVAGMTAHWVVRS